MESWESFRAELELLGEAKVRELRARGELSSLWDAELDAWLAHKAHVQAEAAASRREVREEETLSNSRRANELAERALTNARIATLFAIMATVIAAREIIESVLIRCLDRFLGR
jgi:DNA-binding sugar fermentation-stimulating protein